MKKLLIICAVATFTASAWAASETIASTNLNSVLVVGSGDSFEVTGNMSLATTAGATGKVENYGTMTVKEIDLGKYSAQKGALAQFDNYGTLTIGTHLRMGVLGTPSVFYNHEGGTVTKGGTGDYTFYLGANTPYSVSTLISEGDFTFSGSPLRMAARDRTTNHVVLAKSGTFTANGYMRVGEQGYSYNTLTMKDNSLLTGSGGFAAPYAASGAEKAQAYVTLSNNAAIVKSSGDFIIGGQKNGIGVMTLNDSSRVERTGALDIGRAVGAIGHVELHDTSYLRAAGYLNVGAAVSDANGELELTDSAQITNNVLIVGSLTASRGTAIFGGESHIENLSTAYIGHGNDNYYGSTGTVTFADSATGMFKWYINLGSGKESKGALTIKDNASVYVTSNACLGVNTGSEGVVTVSDNASFTVATNLLVASVWKSRGELSIKGNATVSALNDMTVGNGNSSTGLVTLADNSRLVVYPKLEIAAKDAGGVGTVRVAGGVLQSISNHIGTASNGKGVLEVASGGMFTNVLFMQVGSSSSGASGLLKMSGGTVLFDPAYHKDHAPLYLNPPLSRCSGEVRGWGKIAFENPRTMVSEAEKPGGLIHYGQVIADGEGQMRDLDCGRFGVIPYQTTNPNTHGTNGWFAVNKGRLKLPRSLPRKTASYNCVGDYWALDTSRQYRLANTFTYTLAGATLNNYMFAELYATDRDDIPAGLDSIGADKVLSVWRIGHFSDGPEIDEPEHPAEFTSATLRFRYATDGIAGLNYMRVYRHDGTASGEWQCVGRADVSATNPLISAKISAPSTGNWNMGWFAITGRINPMGMTVIIK